MVDVRERLGEEHVGTGVDVGLGTLEGRGKALAGKGVGPGHDHKALIPACRHSCLNAVHHLGRCHNPFVRPMPAPLVLRFLNPAVVKTCTDAIGILFEPSLVYSIPFYLSYSILFYSILFYSILFYSILFYFLGAVGDLVFDVQTGNAHSLKFLDGACHVEHAPEARVGIHQERQVAHPVRPTNNNR
jgi:hypothetical protein